MSNRLLLSILSSSLLLGSLTGCGDDTDSDDQQPDTVDAVVTFEVGFGDQPFACGETYDGVGTNNGSLTPSDMRFYIHDLELIADDGAAVAVELTQDGKWQVENVALLDFEDASGPCSNGTPDTNKTVEGTAPGGHYVGVRFTIGLPAAMNHADVATAPSPLNLSGMFWSWNKGYKFLRFDSMEASNNPYVVHLGSTGCAGEAIMGEAATCSNLNLFTASFPTAGDESSAVIKLDLSTLLAGVDVSMNTEGTAPGCQSGIDDPECVNIFEALGIGSGEQTIFTAK